MRTLPLGVKMTQELAQNARGAILKEQVNDVMPGSVLTLTWERSYLDYPLVFGGVLVHEFLAYAYNSFGLYVSIKVTDQQIEAIRLWDLIVDAMKIPQNFAPKPPGVDIE